MLDENRFLAARDGMEARLIDPTREELRPVADILDELLDAVAPHAAELGCEDELAGVRTLAADPGAVRQRRGETSETGLARTVASLADQFARLTPGSPAPSDRRRERPSDS